MLADVLVAGAVVGFDSGVLRLLIVGRSFQIAVDAGVIIVERSSQTAVAVAVAVVLVIEPLGRLSRDFDWGNRVLHP